jgi:baculoviral IAP repeat-containing protein 6
MLPLNRSSSVFVRVDEANCFMWRALITGPEDTPYSGGCFIFDMWFPGQYPSVPPQVGVESWGGGVGAMEWGGGGVGVGKRCSGCWSGGWCIMDY